MLIINCWNRDIVLHVYEYSDAYYREPSCDLYVSALSN